MWLKHDCKLIFHASGKVIGLVDNSTLAIMDAVTLHELERCDISPRHTALPGDRSGRLSGVAWSGSGTLLAAAICSSTVSKGIGPQDSMAEVLIIDTASGRCLQCVSMHAYHVELKWSPGPADLLAVSSVRKCQYDRNHTASGRMRVLDTPQADLRLLRPCCQEVVQVNCTVPDFPRAQWTDPYWSPHGQLLVAGWHSNDSTYQQGCTIFDSKTLEHISTFPQDPRSISWALKIPSSLQRSRLSAFFPELCAGLSFISHGSGSGWTDVCKHCNVPQACTDVSLSPCGCPAHQSKDRCVPFIFLFIPLARTLARMALSCLSCQSSGKAATLGSSLLRFHPTGRRYMHICTRLKLLQEHLIRPAGLFFPESLQQSAWWGLAVLRSSAPGQSST